jgi:hypothetical protein
LYGIGQGVCASPILWELLNQLTCTALGGNFYCIILVALYGEEEHIRQRDSFLDDTTTGVMDDKTKMDQVPVEVKDMTQREEDLIGQI